MARRPVERDCDQLGLTDQQRAGLTGFSGRAVRALAHLREAWCSADPGNRIQIERAIRTLLLTHSLGDIPVTCARVLAHGLDGALADRLRAAVEPGRAELEAAGAAAAAANEAALEQLRRRSVR